MEKIIPSVQTRFRGSIGRTWPFIIVICAATSIRFLYLADNINTPFFANPRLDGLFHDKWALSIASGNIMGDQVFFRAPLYPYFLGLLYAVFGHDYVIARIVQHIFGVASVLLTMEIGKQMFSRSVGILSGILLAGYGLIVYFEGELLFESMLLFLVLVSLWLFLLILRKKQFQLVFILGIVFGLVCITRPLFLIFIPLLIWIIASHARQMLSGSNIARPLLFLTGLAIVIAPVTIRNYLVSDSFVLIASQGGVNFYIGNNPLADGYTSSIPLAKGPNWENRDATYQVEKQIGHKPTAAEESAYWYKQGVDFGLQNPGKFIQLLFKKLYLYWNALEIPNNQSFYDVRANSQVLQLLPFGFWLIGPLGLMGIVLAGHKKGGKFILPFVAIYMIATIMFFVTDRYRVPIIPLLCIGSAFSSVRLVRLARLKLFRVLAIHIGALLALAVVVNSNIYGLSFHETDRRQFAIGLVALEAGNYDSAIVHLREAASLSRPLPGVMASLGVAEWMMDSTEAAANSFQKELTFFPESHQALSALAQLNFEKGRIDSAMNYAFRAIHAKPYLGSGYVVVAKAKMKLGLMAEAESTLVNGRINCRDSFLYGSFLLGGIMLSHGRIGEARMMYRDVVYEATRQSQPSYEPELGYSVEGREGLSIARIRSKAYYGLAHTFLRQGGLDSGIVFLRRAFVNDSTNYEPIADLGVAYLRRGDLEQAEKFLERASEMDSTNHLILFNLALVMRAEGRHREAEDILKRITRLEPDFARSTVAGRKAN